MPLTFVDFHARTAELTGPARLEAFYALPEDLQRECWADLAERMAWRAELDFRDWCRDGR
jgi:hypothetical protein